jgi:hypothetical protein
MIGFRELARFAGRDKSAQAPDLDVPLRGGRLRCTERARNPLSQVRSDLLFMVSDHPFFSFAVPIIGKMMMTRSNDLSLLDVSVYVSVYIRDNKCVVNVIHARVDRHKLMSICG